MNKLMTFAAVAVSTAIPMAAFAENASMAATCAAAAGDGSFPDVLESRKTREVEFAKPVKARYFRFVATHALPVNDRLAVAEVDVL